MATGTKKESPAYSQPESGEETTTEVVKANNFSAEELRGIASFADVQKLFAEHDIQVVSAADELGDGFQLVSTDEKDQFIGREMMILSWAFGEGDVKKPDGSKSEFVAMRFVVAEQGGGVGKYVITDGGTGIYKTLREYTDRTGNTGGLHVKKGLRASRYTNEFTDDGVTHYIDLSK